MPKLPIEEYIRRKRAGEPLDAPYEEYPEGTTFISTAKPGAVRRGIEPHIIKQILREEGGELPWPVEFGKDIAEWEAARLGGKYALMRAGVGLHPAGRIALMTMGPLKEAVEGALTGRDPMETFEQMGYSGLTMAGLDMLLPYLGKAAKGVGKGAKHVRGMGGVVAEGWGEILKRATDVPIAKPLQHMFPQTFHGASLRELFQPVVERAEPFLKGVLSQKEKIGDLARQATAEMAGRIKELSLEERYFVADFIKSGRFDPGRGRHTTAYMRLPLDSKARITHALEPFAQWQRIVERVNPKHHPLRQLELLKQIQERFLPVLGEEGAVLDSIYLDELMPFIKGKATVEEARGAFRSVMDHPELGDETKLLAKDLYTLHHTVAETFPTAVQHAEKTILFSKFRNMTRHTSPVKKEGFVRATHPSFKGTWVSKDMDQAIKEYEYMPAPFSRNFNKYFLTPWKMNKVVFRVPTQFRNIISNVILNDIGGLSISNPKNWKFYVRSARELRHHSAGTREFAQLTGMGTTFAEVETAPLLRHLERHSDLLTASDGYLQQLAGNFEKGILSPMKIANRAYQMEEIWAKYAKYMHNLSKGMNKRAAADDAVRWTFNYGQVTPFTKTLRQTVSPFATWTVKVLPLVAEALIQHPLRVAKWFLLPYFMTQAALGQYGMTEKEWGQLKNIMPDYLSKGLVGLIPTRDAEGRMQLVNFTWFMPGLGDITQLYAGFSTPTEVAQTLTQNPLLSIAGDLRHNKTFSGMPIYYEWEPPELKAQKLLGYFWSQLAPGIISTDVSKLKRALEQGPGAPTTGQFVAGQFGIPIVPIEPERLMQNRIYRLKAAKREISSRLKNEMMRAKTPAKQQAVVRKYEKIMKSLYEEWGKE